MNEDIFKTPTIFRFVYFQAIEQLNLKSKNFKDLLTDEVFSREDIVILQDNKDSDKHNMEKFYHLNKNLNLNKEGKPSLIYLYSFYFFF